MLSGKRLLLEDEEEDVRFSKRSCLPEGNTMYTSFGPIPIEWFDASLFPKTAMVTVYVPQTVVEQVVPMSIPTSPSLGSPSGFTEYLALPQSSCAIPLPSLLSSDCSMTEVSESFQDVPKDKQKPRVVFGKKTDVKHILSLLDVTVYSELRSPFSPRMLLESIPESMVTKKRNMVRLLKNCEKWHGVGVLTMYKESKHLSRQMFTPDLTSISQYVRPLGFGAEELVLPSNAICYTSYNKGNRQVTYILTDVLKYADIVRYNKTTVPKSKRRARRADTNKVSEAKSVNPKRFSYGMTVLKDRVTPLDVQLSMLTLMSLAFFLLRKWCRSSQAFSSLLEPAFVEPSFEELSASLIQESGRVLTTPFSDREIHLLLKRANCLFKKLVQLFLALYPDNE